MAKRKSRVYRRRGGAAALEAAKAELAAAEALENADPKKTEKVADAQAKVSKAEAELAAAPAGNGSPNAAAGANAAGKAPVAVNAAAVNAAAVNAAVAGKVAALPVAGNAAAGAASEKFKVQIEPNRGGYLKSKKRRTGKRKSRRYRR